MPGTSDPARSYAALDSELRDLLGLNVPPIAITFAAAPPSSPPAFGAAHPPPTPDGRTGAVSASCVFWMHATERSFATAPEDHGNCSVGRVTHGFAPLADVVANADVQALLAADWVTAEAASLLPTVPERPAAVVYGPLAAAASAPAPDIVFLRINGKQLMLLHDAWPGLRFEGKPQCHIIPLALQSQEIAVSSGCMLSRVRTGMTNHEVTCAIPSRRLAELVDRLRAARRADVQVAAYAAEDARRFA